MTRLCPSDFDVGVFGSRVMLMVSMSDFKKLQVWQKAHALSLAIDRTSMQMRGARYGSLRSQIFRAAMSIPANIAEGRRQKSEKEFARFLGHALNSSSELEYHLIVARDTKGIPESEFVCLITQTITVRKMLYGLVKRLATAAGASTKPSSRPQPTAGTPKAPGR